MTDELRPRPTIGPPYMSEDTIIRMIYSDARVPADLRLRIGIAKGWLPHNAKINQVPTPPADTPAVSITPVALTISLFHQFGRVCTTGTRIPVDSLWEPVAAGDSIDDTAEAFGVRRADVLMACWWGARNERAVRKAWWEWAEQLEHATYGQTADTVDWTTIPDPPAIEQPNKHHR